MNKQLTKKTIGIAASAALMATAAFSSNAFAAPGGNPRASVGVDTLCEITDVENADMVVHVKIEDKSSGVAYNTATLASVSIEVGSKDKGKDFDHVLATKLATADVAIDGTQYYPVAINICGDGDFGKAINATTTVTLGGLYPSSKGNYTAQCGAHPGDDGEWGTDDDFTAGLKTADYPGLGSACP